MRFEDIRHDPFDGRSVRDLDQPFFPDDGLRRLAGVGHLVEDRLGDLSADGPLVDELQEAPQIGRRDRRFLDGLALGIEPPQQRPHDPVAHGLGLGEGLETGFEVIGQLLAGGEDLGVVGGQAEGRYKPFFSRLGQLRQGLADRLDPVVVNGQRQEVRVGEVAVVVGFLLAAHGCGQVPVGVPEPGFLGHKAAVGDPVLLAGHLELDGLFDVFK